MNISRALRYTAAASLAAFLAACAGTGTQVAGNWQQRQHQSSHRQKQHQAQRRIGYVSRQKNRGEAW